MIDENGQEREVIKYIVKNGKITNRECRALLGVSYDESIRLLNSLFERGLITRIGVAAGTKYILPAEQEDSQE